MFKRVLLCYDGSDAGRKALKRGAELAQLVGAQVFVLAVLPSDTADPRLTAAAAGTVCLVDYQSEYEALLAGSLEWLIARGIAAQGCLARGNTIEVISDHAQRVAADLVVVGNYPKATGGRW